MKSANRVGIIAAFENGMRWLRKHPVFVWLLWTLSYAVFFVMLWNSDEPAGVAAIALACLTVLIPTVVEVRRNEAGRLAFALLVLGLLYVERRAILNQVRQQMEESAKRAKADEVERQNFAKILELNVKQNAQQAANQIANNARFASLVDRTQSVLSNVTGGDSYILCKLFVKRNPNAGKHEADPKLFFIESWNEGSYALHGCNIQVTEASKATTSMDVLAQWDAASLAPHDHIINGPITISNPGSREWDFVIWISQPNGFYREKFAVRMASGKWQSKYALAKLTTRENSIGYTVEKEESVTSSDWQ